MGYRIYSTEGLILSSANFGEANKLVKVFTLKFGLINILAQSLRAGKSKLRSLVEPLTLAEISLIRGREFWRLIGAEEIDSLKNLKSDNEKKKPIGRIFNLLIRLISGEEKNEELYLVVKNGLFFLQTMKGEKELLLNWESLMVLRILKHLGYKIANENLDLFLATDQWSEEELSAFSTKRREANLVINFLLKHSQL
ncbi:MAG: DNA repair protein RecO [Candidatus Vogelbacteria bacterium]|nr:DNA repair protein RecO [Candidatus Vogelbacteria bacterium]